MKIIHVTNAVGWSGGCQQLTYLIEGLEALGHQNILVCPPRSELLARLSKTSAVFETCSMFQDYDLFAARRIRNLVKKYAPDILHTHHAMAHAISLVALQGTHSPPLVVSRRVSFKMRNNIFSRWKYGSRRIQRYVAVSHAIKGTLIQGGVPAPRIQVIYSAYDARNFFPQPPHPKIVAELKIPNGFKIVGKLANYSEWKGQKIFLEAAKILLQIDKNLIFVLIGHNTEDLREYCRDLGIADSVRLLGFRKDVPHILSTLNLSVNSAIEGEGLSGALRESLAMKIPVIASDVSGNREIVQNGNTGLLVPKNDPRILAKKMEEALNSELAMKSLANRGFQWVQENCSLNTMVHQHRELYKNLI